MQQSFIAGGVPVVAMEIGNGVTGTVAVRVERLFVMQMFAPPLTRDLLLGGVEVDAWVARGMPTTRIRSRWAVCGLGVSMSSQGVFKIKNVSLGRPGKVWQSCQWCVKWGWFRRWSLQGWYIRGFRGGAGMARLVCGWNVGRCSWVKCVGRVLAHKGQGKSVGPRGHGGKYDPSQCIGWGRVAPGRSIRGGVVVGDVWSAIPAELVVNFVDGEVEEIRVCA